jgi:hypothetical protein
MDNSMAELLRMAGDPAAALPKRLDALGILAAHPKPTAIPNLKKLLGRAKPGPESAGENWDPAGAERVVDLRIVETLHAWGDDSELDRIPALVAGAQGILEGADDELGNAAAVIRAIGSTAPVAGLVSLAADGQGEAVTNAVRTLEMLCLPETPVRQSLEKLPHLFAPVGFTITRLKQEMEALASLSQSTVVLSPGVRAFLAQHDYERGTVERDQVLLADIIDRFVPILGFDYFVEKNQVVICTYAEAGARWQAWWKQHGADLTYAKDQAAFVLRTRP